MRRPSGQAPYLLAAKARRCDFGSGGLVACTVRIGVFVENKQHKDMAELRQLLEVVLLDVLAVELDPAVRCRHEQGLSGRAPSVREWGLHAPDVLHHLPPLLLNLCLHSFSQLLLSANSAGSVGCALAGLMPQICLQLLAPLALQVLELQKGWGGGRGRRNKG